MRDFRIRQDIQRAVVGGFAFPLGIEPGEMAPPAQGYTLQYAPGEDEEPDVYTFYVVVSLERLGPIIQEAFRLLPDEVYGIVEIGSRDAYRAVDVYLGKEPTGISEFIETWEHFEPILMEDGSIGAGANSEEPFVEVFLDQWKGLSIIVPPDMQDEVEAMLQKFGLSQVERTWPETDENDDGLMQVRPVLEVTDEYSPDLDELLLQLRHEWRLDLNIDPDTNLDERGRNLGLTLWHAVVVVQSTAGEGDKGAYLSFWATANSMAQMAAMVEEGLTHRPEWRFLELYTMDRVAFDERPDSLGDLPPRRTKPELHLVEVDPWVAQPDHPRE